MKNEDETNYRIYTVKSEADKAINSLKGILTGISIDNEVNSDELNELSKWVEDNHFLINKNPFREFMNLISDRISNSSMTPEDIEDLIYLAQKYENDNIYYNGITADLQLLQGICHGILSDGIINDIEIFELNNWLKKNKHLTSYFPYDELTEILNKIIEDNKIDENERIILKAYFYQFVKLKNNSNHQTIIDEVSCLPISLIYSTNPVIDFVDKIFCLTGKFQGGKQEDLLKYIVGRGGISSNGMSKKVDYLIVGDNGNEAWAFSCYGRKVEIALNYRKEGRNILIINEFELWEYLKPN